MAVGPIRGGPLHHRGKLFHATEVAPGVALATSGLRGQAVPSLRRAGRRLRRPRRVVQEIGVRDRHLGTLTSFCQVLTQSRVSHDRKVDIAGNGRRPADILLKPWVERRDLAVDLTIVHPNPVACRPLRGSAATFLKDKGEHKCRKSAESCGRMGVDFSPMVFDTWRGSTGPGTRW